MTKIELLRTGDIFVTKWSINEIYNYFIDDKFCMIPLVNGSKLLLSNNEPILCKEVK